MMTEEEKNELTPDAEDTPTPLQEPTPPPVTNPRLDRLATAVERVRTELGKVVVGQQEYVELLIAALFAGGHVLVEGVPGIAKTLTAKLLAQTLQVDFNRIQFTPDLMPKPGQSIKICF